VLGCVCLIALGLLMGVSFVRPLFKSAGTRAKFEALIMGLWMYQGGLGVVAIVLGVWALLTALA